MMERLVNLLCLFLLTSCLGSADNSYGQKHNSKKQQSFEKKEYYCEYCGKKFSDIRDLSINSCKKHPKGVYKGSHKLYRGQDKEKYTCRYCGKTARTISDLVSSTCKHAPKKGWHRPR